MTRAEQTVALAAFATFIYLACFLQYIPFPKLIQDEIIPVLPFWALVSFGSYLLFKLGYGVFTFNDIPKEYQSLLKEIDAAKKDLRSKGVTVD